MSKGTRGQTAGAAVPVSGSSSSEAEHLRFTEDFAQFEQEVDEELAHAGPAKDTESSPDPPVVPDKGKGKARASSPAPPVATHHGGTP